MTILPFLSYCDGLQHKVAEGGNSTHGAVLQGRNVGIDFISEDVVATFIDKVTSIEGIDDILPVHTSTRLGYSFIEATKQLTNGSDADAQTPTPRELLDISKVQDNTDSDEPAPRVRMKLCVSIEATAIAKDIGHRIEKELYDLWKKEQRNLPLPNLDGIDVHILAIGC